MLENAPEMGAEHVELIDSAGRFLAEDVFSDINMPPFNRSAVDGFACRRADLGSELLVIETIRAGQSPKKQIATGQCTRIMTGSPVPEGADCVLMVEETQETANGKIRFTGQDTKANISPFAEDVKEGDRVLEAGTLIKPQHIAILAAVGHIRPLVSKQPSVAIISTGDEIVEPHLKPGLSQIRNSNGYQLACQVGKAGAIADYMGIASDNEKDTLDIILKALETNDVVILTGGISMGTFDFVPGVMEMAGIDIKIRKMSVQPGKPTIFGIKGDKRIIGLPGNPVSAFTVFEILVKPMLWKMMGIDKPFQVLRLPIGTDYSRQRADRMQWMPVRISDGKAFPLEFHGSAHIFSLAQADAIAAVPLGTTELTAGELIDARPI